MKTDYQRRIDQGHPGNGKRAYGVPTSSGTGLPYSASLTPQPITIPVALESGKLHPGWLPDYAPNSGYGEGSPSGQQIIAPWVYLVQPLPVGATTITVTGNGLAVGDNITLSHASMPNEEAAVTGGPVQVGALYEYTLSRPNEQHDYPAYARAYNRGAVSDGGWITVVSGDQSDNLVAPHINLWTYDGDGNAERRVRIGRLVGLSTAEKAQFPKVDDWNVYGLYADAAYLRGQIVADSGDIAGDLDVGGTLGVWSGLGRAGVVLGNSEGGHGITLQNREGRPVFGAVSPYEDESGVLSDVAVWIDNKGEKGLYYHLDQATGEYQLEIGVDTLVDGTLTAANILAGDGTYPGGFTGMRLGSEGLQSFGTDYLEQIALDIQTGYFYFGGREGWLGREGMTIDTRLYDTDKALLEHAVRWIHPTTRPSAPAENIGAALGSGTSTASGQSFVFMHTERSLWDLGIPTAAQDDYARAGLMAFAGGTSTFYGQVLALNADSRVFVTVGDGQSSVFDRTRVSLPALTVPGSGYLLHTHDDGATVGMGTDASGRAARLIVEQDDRPAIRAQRGDQHLSVWLASYVPPSQQSTLPGGYVMRANSTVGISGYTNASANYNAVQDWLAARGLQPYTPQLAELENQNVATQYDDITGGLNWTQAAVDEVKKFPHPMVIYYSEYFYKNFPEKLEWTLGGVGYTQDELDLAGLTAVLAQTKTWFSAVGIFSPWIMIDEPPHGTAGDWTQEIEDRVIKFVQASLAAGFTVGVAMPGPTQLAYWRSRISPTRWILAAKHERNEYAAVLPAGELWLYNRTNKVAGKPMAGLAQQMRDFGAVGYLHWSANSDVGTWPLISVWESGGAVTAIAFTEYGNQLIEELRLFAETDVPPVQPVYEQWLWSSGNMVLAPEGGYVLPPTSAPLSLGKQDRPLKHIYAQHLHGAIGSQIALSSGSSMYISAYAPVLGVGLETANVVAYFEQSDLPLGKFLRATNAESESYEVIKLLSTGRVAGDWWEYDVERAAAGTAQYWPAGTTWVDLGGNDTDGFVRMWGADDENPATGPAMGIWQRDNDDAWDSTSIRYLAGNLNGFYDFDHNVWGLAAGKPTGKWFSVTDESGLRIMDGSTQRAIYREYAQVGNPDGNNVMITDSMLALRTGEVAYIEMDNAGNLDLTGTMAVATGGAITWAGGKGRADDEGLEHVEDVNNYFTVKPGAFSFLVVSADGFSSVGATISGQDVGVQGWSETGTGVVGGGMYGVIGTSYDVGAGVVGQGMSPDSVGVLAFVANGGIIALQIDGGIVDGGAERYTNLANAEADTDAINRQTGDLRYGRRWRTWLEAA